MKKNYSPFSLYAYLSVVLIGLGSLILVTTSLKVMQRMMSNLKSGLALPAIKQRWLASLYPLLQQVQELINVDQDIANLREGWMAQIAYQQHPLQARVGKSLTSHLSCTQKWVGEKR